MKTTRTKSIYRGAPLIVPRSYTHDLTILLFFFTDTETPLELVIRQHGQKGWGFPNKPPGGYTIRPYPRSNKQMMMTLHNISCLKG